MISTDPGQTAWYFSPSDDAQAALLGVVTAEQEELCVEAYSLTLPAFVAALKANHDRGLAQLVLADESQFHSTPEDRAAVQELIGYGIPTLVGTTPSGDILHAKVLLGKSQAAVWSGSYNFSPSAARESNTSSLCYSGLVWTAMRADFETKWQWVQANVPQSQFTRRAA